MSPSCCCLTHRQVHPLVVASHTKQRPCRPVVAPSWASGAFFASRRHTASCRITPPPVHPLSNLEKDVESRLNDCYFSSSGRSKESWSRQQGRPNGASRLPAGNEKREGVEKDKHPLRPRRRNGDRRRAGKAQTARPKKGVVQQQEKGKKIGPSSRMRSAE